MCFANCMQWHLVFETYGHGMVLYSFLLSIDLRVLLELTHWFFRVQIISHEVVMCWDCTRGILIEYFILVDDMVNNRLTTIRCVFRNLDAGEMSECWSWDHGLLPLVDWMSYQKQQFRTFFVSKS